MITFFPWLALLTRIGFNILWRSFSWSNQTLAVITLWAALLLLGVLLKTAEISSIGHSSK